MTILTGSSNPHLIRLVALISGSGSNLQAIIDACDTGRLSAQVVAVIANRPNAFGLTRAEKNGIPAIVKNRTKLQDRLDYDGELARLVTSYRPDWVILAGWMYLLSSAFLNCFPAHVINLHPALPGNFPGTHAIERAYQAYQNGEIQHTGVMIHLVPDAGVDNGPILAQEIVPIMPDDQLETLEARIHQVEHRLLVDTIDRLIRS